MTNLPKNWVETTLSDVMEIYDSERKPVNSSEREKRISGKEKSELYPYYGATGQVGYIDNYIFNDEFVLLGEDGAPFLEFLAKKAFIVRGKFWVNNHAHILKSKTSNKFLCFFLNQFDYHNFVTGTTRYKLTQSDMCKIPIPLPPLAEQGRIVAKIEDLFAGIDAGVESLKSVKNQIALYRQSVLKSVLSGLATDTLSNHVDMCLGKMLDKEKNKGTLYPYLRNKNVRWANFELDDLLEMRFEKSEEERYSIQRGDLVVCEGGEPGRCAVWENDNVIKFQKALHRLRPHDNMNVYFLMYVFMLNIQAKNWDQFFTGSTIKHLTGEALKNLQIPVPALAEQERIVAEIESRFERADALETAVDRALSDAEKLKQAVLKKAFAGELVPQNPDDEPASVLLDRIRAARASEHSVKKGKRK